MTSKKLYIDDKFIEEVQRSSGPVIQNRSRTEFTKNKVELFFSLIVYRNNLFTSNSETKLNEFYNGFSDINQLIKWNKERPKGSTYIHEVEGNEKVVVVIPTSDWLGNYSINCKENIFKGLHIVFVESADLPDPFFNYAHSCNVGINKALEYDPDWIILSNDDMYKIDEIEVLIKELEKINNKEIKTVVTEPSNYHSRPFVIGLPRKLTYKLFLKVLSIHYPERFINHVEHLEKKFDLKVKSLLSNKIIEKIIFSKIYSHFTISSAFSIYSGNWLKSLNGRLMDENYINGTEDIEISMKIANYQKLDIVVGYKIGDFVGSSLGRGSARQYRDIANRVYFEYVSLPKILDEKTIPLKGTK